MSEQLFDVVFFGILQAGKDRELVIQNMAQLFKTDTTKLAPYFAGGRKVIKGKINAENAEKYKAALENAGLVIKVEPCNNEKAEEQAEQTSHTAVSPQPPASTSPPAHNEQQTASIEVDGITMAPVGADVVENPVAVPAQKIADISGLSMAEVGADVIENPVAKPVQEIADISGLTLAETGADIIPKSRQN